MKRNRVVCIFSVILSAFLLCHSEERSDEGSVISVIPGARENGFLAYARNDRIRYGSDMVCGNCPEYPDGLRFFC